ncbi:MAG: flagellar hook-associated protein FlgK [Spirochaetes bacterium]|nr:flagellar hook-associated protein FlgK [Spirochaetota bacterium]
MHSTFMGIEIGKRSLMAHNKSLVTTGHNIVNASTEGFSRQRVKLATFEPLYAPQLNRVHVPGQIGQGVTSVSVERIRDELLENRINFQSSVRGYWQERDKYILMLENIHNEPGDFSVRAAMDKFWEGWQELSVFPAEMATRQSVLERGRSLIDAIHTRYNSLRQVRDMLETEVVGAVRRINTILADVANLNERILKVKAMGDSPNDLLDRRDLLVNQLASIINITVEHRGGPPDKFLIHTSGFHLVQGRVPSFLNTVVDTENNGYSKVVWAGKHNNDEVQVRSGSLAAFLNLRDRDVREEIQKLDLMTMNFIDNVNYLHKNAWGANGSTGIDFFTEFPFVLSAVGNFDRSGDGVFDSTYIFRITGANTLNPQDLIGLRGTMILSGADANVAVEYFPTDTVQDVLDRINNSPARISATLNMEGKLVFRAMTAQDRRNPDFVIKHIEDSGEFLVGYAGVLAASGSEGAYTWETAYAVEALNSNSQFAVAPLSHPSGWIEVNRAISADIMNIAAGFGVNGRPANPGDGSAALAIASLRNQQLMVGNFTSFDQYFSFVVADIGLKGERARITLATQNLIMRDLEEMRQSISGVNIDEELANMIKFQHGYAAAARFIATMNEMLDIIVNRLKT